MSIYVSGGHILGAGGSIYSTGGGGGGGGFTPDSGFTISSPSGVSNGSIVTVNANSGTPFGTKPFDPRPLFWLPADTSATPSSLGRITVLQAALLSMFSWQSTGGPTGLGCFAGTPSTNTVPNNWTLGIDLPQWSGWAGADPHGGNVGYWANDFGVSIYTFHRELRNFGHLDENGSQSYNGIANYNTKNIRFWPTNPLNSTGVTSLSNIGDMYLPPDNQIFDVENITNSWGLGTDFPSGGGSQPWGAECTTAVIAAENAMNGSWLADEKMLTSNSNASTADANVMWRVPASPTPGPFALGSMYNFPVTTYHTIGWQFLNSSVGQTLNSNLRGTLTRLFIYQFVVEGNDGSGRPSAPVGTFPSVCQIYADDSPCRAVVTNSATWGSEADLQPQPPTAWSGSSVSFSTYNIPLNWYLYIVNSSNSATRVGQRTT